MDLSKFPDVAVVASEAEPVIIAAPSGFALPDGVDEDTPFEATVMVRMKDGQLTLDSINGTPFTEMEEAEEMEDEEDNSMMGMM